MGTILEVLGFRVIKDCSIGGSISGSPCLWELPYKVEGFRSRVMYLVVEVSSGCRNGSGTKARKQKLEGAA